MSGLVLELQRAALDPARSVADVLRMATVVASKLDLGEFREWCEKEASGYREENTPPYRRVRGELRARNPYHGWVPVIIQDRETFEALSERDIGQGVAELEDLLSRGGERDTMQVALPQHILLQVFGDTPEFQLGMVPTLLVGRSAIRGILDAVRNRILDWSLRLEREGVLGEGMTFSRQEVQRAAAVTYHIGTFSGVLGNVQSSNLQFGDYGSIRLDLKRLGVPDTERQEIEEVLDSLPTATGATKEGLLRRGREWLTRNGPTLGAISDQVREWLDFASRQQGGG